VVKRIAAMGLVSLLSASLAWADDKSDIEAVKKVVAKISPGSTADFVGPSVVPGLYEALVGTQVLYVSKDGQFVVNGDIIDIAKHQNLTENKRTGARAKLIGSIDENTMLIFNPTKPVKHTITVFTDVDCGYCRKLHKEMSSYLDRGIRVRYLAFPRSGPNTESYYKWVSVWCAADRRKAMTDAKNGINPPRKDCPNPVLDHMKLAEDFNVNGTPTIVLDNGEVLPGYVPADKLGPMLDAPKKG